MLTLNPGRGDPAKKAVKIPAVPFQEGASTTIDQRQVAGARSETVPYLVTAIQHCGASLKYPKPAALAVRLCRSNRKRGPTISRRQSTASRPAAGKEHPPAGRER